jgi:hypothetical protein
MGLKVNVSQKESESKALDPIPRGQYHVKVTDIETRESKSEKNKGKPYYALELTVQDGDYEGRKLWANVMLFEGALYSIVQICKAMGQDVEEGELEIPDEDELLSEDFIVRVIIKPADDQYDSKNVVKAFKAWDGKVPGKGDVSLLPG